ncbi:MAG: dockerin type I domain-containing protein [Eubacteriales bacterium]|nr:dockerin type I domain-containing protein [Eubacteriales bacterium]
MTGINPRARKLQSQSKTVRKKRFFRHWWTEILMIILALTLVFQIVLLSREEALAEPAFPLSGRVTVNELSLRAEPDPDGALLCYMLLGESLLIVDQTYYGIPVNDNPIWYEVEYKGQKGWASAEYVDYLDLPSVADVSSQDQLTFVAELQGLGFPLSYAEQLYSLHLKYPQWSFKPLFTNYSFETAIEGELAHHGSNLVPAHGPDAHKSRAAHDYSFITNSWHQYEYGWVGASREILEHVMDPRNFLNEREIFQFENLQYNPAVQSVDGVRRILSDSFMAGTEAFSYIDYTGSTVLHNTAYAEVFMEAAEYANVNPYHLASRVKLEVSPKGSDSVSGSYRGITGYYNFFNIGAYPLPGEGDSVYNGLITARDGIEGISQESYERLLFPWTSPYRAILGGASFLGRDYINADQQTLYLQKFNLVSRYFPPFQHQYMGNIFAPQLEAVGVYEAYREIEMLAQPKEFLIPVFTELPNSTAEPIYPGSPNNRLRSLRVNGEELPDFNYSVNSYYLELTDEQPYVEITAELLDLNATVSGTGIHFLNEGLNHHHLTVTAEDGSIREYELMIDFQLTSQEAEAEFELLNYAVDSLGFLYGVDPAQGQNQPEIFATGLSLGPGIEVYYSDQAGNPSPTIGTGTEVSVYHNDELYKAYTVVIRGDVNGDGVVDITDAKLISQYLVGRAELSQAQLLAMDANGDGSGDLLDARRILDFVLNGNPISQSLVY